MLVQKAISIAQLRGSVLLWKCQCAILDWCLAIFTLVAFSCNIFVL